MEELRYTTDVENFSRMIESIAREVGYSEDEVKDIVKCNEEAFINTLGYKASPSAFFSPIANGSFKETYHPVMYHGKFVIKFISEDNETDLEQKILDLATKAGVSQFFVPTTYMDLTYCELPAELIAEDDENICCADEEAPLVAVCVQPFAKPAGTRAHTPVCGCYYETLDKRMGDYEKNPLTYNDGESIVPFDMASRLSDSIDDGNWWQLTIDAYGLAAAEALITFIEDNEINDLHEWNYGYMNKDDKVLPVIMDWLSGF